jgi:predicted ABC-type transport system involved in lysophospholipase L1 biosynthesis ATPase subunit
MTTNTAGNAATAAETIGQAERRGGTSVLLRDLTRAFGATRALDGLSIEMAPGELVALLGPSGCGKTTALRIVAGFETADTGSVLVDGKDISSVSAAKRDMGMVFQSYSLFPNMSALDNVAFGLRMRKIGSAGRRKRASDLLDMVGLAPQARQYPHQLSGGQQQRVALARALDVLVRPESLHMEVVENGNGIVTARTFLGSVTRVGVQLSGDVAVQVDRPSTEAAALTPGASVSVSLPAQPVLVAARRVS